MLEFSGNKLKGIIRGDIAFYSFLFPFHYRISVALQSLNHSQIEHFG